MMTLYRLLDKEKRFEPAEVCVVFPRPLTSKEREVLTFALWMRKTRLFGCGVLQDTATTVNEALWVLAAHGGSVRKSCQRGAVKVDARG